MVVYLCSEQKFSPNTKPFLTLIFCTSVILWEATEFQPKGQSPYCHHQTRIAEYNVNLLYFIFWKIKLTCKYFKWFLVFIIRKDVNCHYQIQSSAKKLTLKETALMFVNHYGIGTSLLVTDHILETWVSGLAVQWRNGF